MFKKYLFSTILFLCSWCSYCQSVDTTRSPDTTQSGVNTQTPSTTGQNDKKAKVVSTNNQNKADSANPLQEEYSVAYEDQKKHPEILYHFKAKTYWPSLIISFLVIFGISISLLLTTALCKDQSFDPKTNLLRPIAERPYSYSRIQLFWWTTIILSSYVAFYFYTGILSALTPTMVILLGGGIAVSLFGKVMDDSQIQQDKKPDAQNNSITSTVPVRHQDIEPSQGLFKDILSDEGGVSIYRFQAVVFNIVFGLGFITAFIRNTTIESFPFLEFEGWQLTLLGISSAGYLSFKANENSKATKLERQIEAVTNSIPQDSASSSFLIQEEKADSPKNDEPTSAFKNLQEKLKEKGLLK